MTHDGSLPKAKKSSEKQTGGVNGHIVPTNATRNVVPRVGFEPTPYGV